MATKTIKARLKLKTQTAAEWAEKDPVLLNGEVGFVADASPAKFKIGDGTKKWSELSWGQPTTLAQLAADASHRLVTDAEKDKWNLEYTIEKVATESSFASTYHLKKGGNKVGASINIPLDQVLRGSSIKTVTTVNTPYTGAKVGDKYVEFLFQNNNTPQYLPVQDLVDIYTGDDTYIEVSASNVIQIKYDALKNRLKTDFDAVYDAKGAAEAFLTDEENVFILDGNA